MKIFNETIKYIFKNLIFLFAFAIIPACFIGGMLQPFPVINFLKNYINLTISNFGNILSPLFGLDWVQLINWIFALIIIVLVVSTTLGNVENHFRSGKLNIDSSASFINNNILATVAYLMVYIISYVVFKFVLGLFIFILHIVFGRLGQTPTMLLVVLSDVVSLACFAAFGVVFMFLMLGLIDTLNSGYSFRTSMANVSELIRGKIKLILGMILFPFAIIMPLIVCGYIYNFLTIAHIVSLTIIFMYYPVLAYTCYYELSGITRYDNVKHYFKTR